MYKGASRACFYCAGRLKSDHLTGEVEAMYILPDLMAIEVGVGSERSVYPWVMLCHFRGHVLYSNIQDSSGYFGGILLGNRGE